MRSFENLKIAVAGTGYVGLSIATLLAQHHTVTAVDIIPEEYRITAIAVGMNEGQKIKWKQYFRVNSI